MGSSKAPLSSGPHELHWLRARSQTPSSSCLSAGVPSTGRGFCWAPPQAALSREQLRTAPETGHLLLSGPSCGLSTHFQECTNQTSSLSKHMDAPPINTMLCLRGQESKQHHSRDSKLHTERRTSYECRGGVKQIVCNLCFLKYMYWFLFYLVTPFLSPCWTPALHPRDTVVRTRQPRLPNVSGDSEWRDSR